MQSLIETYRSKPSLLSVMSLFMIAMYIGVLTIPKDDVFEILFISLLFGSFVIFVVIFDYFTFIHVYPGRIEGRRLIFIMKKNSFHINDVKEIRRFYQTKKISSRGLKGSIDNSMRQSIWSGIEFVLEKPQKHRRYIQMNIKNLREIIGHILEKNPEIKVSKEVFDKLLKQ